MFIYLRGCLFRFARNTAIPGFHLAPEVKKKETLSQVEIKSSARLGVAAIAAAVRQAVMMRG